MKTLKNNKKTFRKTRSKKQRGRGAACSIPGNCIANNNIENQGDPNHINDYLELAIIEEMPIQVEEYLGEGANPNISIIDDHEYIRGSQRVPAIIYTARHINSPTIMELLLQNGVSIEKKYDTSTPLIEAAEWGNLSAVEFLLDNGANINATTGSGVNAIGYAVLNEDIPMVNLMLDKRRGEIKLNYTEFDLEERTVIQDIEEIEENGGNPELAKILIKYVIEQQALKDIERRKPRVLLGEVMDKGYKRRMPSDLTYKILLDHFSGKKQKGGKKKRKTRKNRSKK